MGILKCYRCVCGVHLRLGPVWEHEGWLDNHEQSDEEDDSEKDLPQAEALLQEDSSLKKEQLRMCPFVRD